MRRTSVALLIALPLLLTLPAQAMPQSGPVGPASAVLMPADASVGTPPNDVAAVLDPLLADRSLGRSVGAVVMDVATGVVVYGKEATTPRALASNQKVLTALAILDALGPEARITTSVLWDAGTATLTLVGAGDPTLASVAATGSSLATLADGVAARVSGAVSLTYDTSLFTGPTIAPGWSTNYPTMGVVAPVSPLIVDRARIPGGDARESNPAQAAARAFAVALADRGVIVDDIQMGSSTGEVIATTESVPVATMVETMLTESDNDSSEILAHLAGAVQSGAGSFASGAAATLTTLQAAGVPLQGANFVDGSGLSYDDIASPLTLVSAVSLAASTPAPAWTWPVGLGLPVAGLTGTLADRFLGPDTRPAAGFVRAKTGTLIGVATLAGTVVDRDGRLLAFAFMSDGTSNIDASRGALDRAAAALAACGCRR